MAYEQKKGTGTLWPSKTPVSRGGKVDFSGKFVSPSGEALVLFGKHKEAKGFKFIEISSIIDKDGAQERRPVAPAPEGDLPF